MFPSVHLLRFCVFFCSSAQNEYNTSISPEPWKPSDCKVKRTEVDDCDNKEGRFIVDVTICASKDTCDDNEPIKSTMHPYNQSCLTGDDFEKFNKTLHEGNIVNCWVSPDEDSVRLDEGTYTSFQIYSRKMRAVFATITSLVFGIVFVYFLWRFSNSLRSPTVFMPTRRSSGITRPNPIASQSQRQHGSSRVVLTVSEAEAFINDHLSASPMNAGTCPICLEEFASENAATVEFPCKHVYHAHCAKPWLLKGNLTCPYCAYDLSPHFASICSKS